MQMSVRRHNGEKEHHQRHGEEGVTNNRHNVSRFQGILLLQMLNVKYNIDCHHAHCGNENRNKLKNMRGFVGGNARGFHGPMLSVQRRRGIIDRCAKWQTTRGTLIDTVGASDAQFCATRAARRNAWRKQLVIVCHITHDTPNRVIGMAGGRIGPGVPLNRNVFVPGFGWARHRGQ